MSSTTLTEMEERYMTLYTEAQGGNPLRSPSVGATSTTAYLGDLEYAIDKERYKLGLPLRFHTESMFSQQAFDPYELEYDLAQLEKELAVLEKAFSGRPIASDFLPVKANLQIQIDQKLTELGRPTRYYLAWELEKILGSDNTWPTEPREPLSDSARLFSAPPAIRTPPRVQLLAAASGDQVATGLTSGLGLVPKPDTVEINGSTTLTLDTLIRKLSAFRSRLGGDAPVWHVEFGGVTEICKVEEWEGGVCIDG